MDKKRIVLRKGHKLPARHAMAKVYYLDGKIEIVTVDCPPSNLSHYRKISKYEYLDTATNKRIAYRAKGETDTKPPDMSRRFATLRRLINNNFAGRSSELHIVLTYGGEYAGKMDDTSKLYKDFRRFWDRFKRRYPSCAYIAIAEPQQSGSFHMHVLMKDLDGHPLYVPKKQLDDLWGQGFTWVRSLKGNSNIGVYFVAHLSDTDNGEQENGSPNRKCIVKGARLSMYPPNFKLYRCSKGIVKPTVEVMPYEDTKLLTEGYSPTFSQTLAVIRVNEDGTENELNSITYEHYKF